MDLLASPPPVDLNDRSWIIHTRTEERPPVWIASGSVVLDSMITDGCEISPSARIERSILSPGVRVAPGAVVRESVILTDTMIETDAIIERSILDKHVTVRRGAHIGGVQSGKDILVAMVGKNTIIPAGMTVEPGAVIGTDVVESDYPEALFVRSSDYIQTVRQPYEI